MSVSRDKRRRLIRLILLAVFCLVVAGSVAALRVFRPDKAARVATGIVAQTLCSDTFVAGLDPARSFTETFSSMPAIRSLLPLLRYDVDRVRKEVSATLAGRFERRAVYREADGCTLVYPGVTGRPAPAVVSPATDGSAVGDIAGPRVVEPADLTLRAALDEAFAEPPSGPRRDTKAVIVLHGGRVVAERYAAGYGIDTPVLGWSMTKSVVNALIGILVREGAPRRPFLPGSVPRICAGPSPSSSSCG